MSELSDGIRAWAKLATQKSTHCALPPSYAAKIADELDAKDKRIAELDEAQALLAEIRVDLNMRATDGVVELSNGLWLRLNDYIEMINP